MPERIGRMLDDHVAVGALAKPAGIAGIRRVDLVGRLLPGHPDSLDVDDDDVVARVQVRGVHRLVLAAQHLRHVGREPAKRLPTGIDDVPAGRDLRWFGAVGFPWLRHRSSTPPRPAPTPGPARGVIPWSTPRAGPR